VAKFLNSEIISTDSRQIFKYLDIGTGKVTEDEKEDISHYMLDFLEADEEYSV
jgi:tRNA dimethylallyltransferase